MTLRFYNSMSRVIETFEPVVAGQANIYCCGPTVYDTPHIGNARPVVVFDTLSKLLGLDHDTRYARNYTDIDDKIITRAAENNMEPALLAEIMINEFEGVSYDLNAAAPTFTPRATAHIPDIITMVLALQANGYAYEAEGNVLFDLSKFPEAGRLSGHKQEDLEAGQHRVEVASYKRNPADFVLWKPAKPGEPSWPSPWGDGRPGWHIECSAMIRACFDNQTLDIHGGGADLRFPHHECEICQSEAVTRKPLAKYWLHNSMVTVDGQKMSKSLGNVIKVRDLLDAGIHGTIIRLALLSTHYRSPLDWTDKLMAQAQQTLSSWHMALEFAGPVTPERNEYAAAIIGALSNDLNTPLAIARVHEAMSDLAQDPQRIAAGIIFATDLMGLQLAAHEDYLRGCSNRMEIENLLVARNAARSSKNYELADRLREELAEIGVVIEDKAGDTRWRVR